ncbi:hypothetical protein D9M71_784490 [compost metagenome]
MAKTTASTMRWPSHAASAGSTPAISVANTRPRNKPREVPQTSSKARRDWSSNEVTRSRAAGIPTCRADATIQNLFSRVEARRVAEGAQKRRECPVCNKVAFLEVLYLS